MDILSFFKQEKTERQLKNLVQLPPKMGRNEVRQLIRNLKLSSFSELTINPKPEYVRLYSDQEIRDKILRDMSKAMETVRDYICKRADLHKDQYDIHPIIIMVGEHGTQGMCKLHYHGVIGGFPNDFLAEFLKRIRSKIGRTELQMIRHEERYVEYMFKSYNPRSEDDTPRELWGNHSYIII